jgi:hypothetical protein
MSRCTHIVSVHATGLPLRCGHDSARGSDRCIDHQRPPMPDDLARTRANERADA